MTCNYMKYARMKVSNKLLFLIIIIPESFKNRKRKKN